MNKGYINIYLMIVTLVLLAFISTATVVLISNMKSMADINDAHVLFYLAEAGVAYGIDQIKTNPGFFTDPSPGTPLKNWLVSSSMGMIYLLDQGGFKIVVPDGSNELYAVGFLGNNILSSAGYCFLKIEYEESPFKIIRWERL